MLKNKRYDKYQLVGKFAGQDSHSHPIYVLKGKNSNWFFKQKNQTSPLEIKEITREVLLQELLRLLIPRHPKTRAILSESPSHGPSGILSKAIPFQSFARINLATLIYNLFSGNITGMGEIAGWLLYSCELDAKLAGNVGIDELNRAIKLDGGEAMLSKRDPDLNKRYPITEQDIGNLPLAPRWTNCNWLDQPIGKNVSNIYSKLWYLMSFNRKFHLELHGLLFRLILLPDSFIDILVTANSPDDAVYQQELSEQFKKRKELIRNNAMRFPPFLIFLKNPNIEHEFECYLQALGKFELHSEKKLVDLCSDYQQNMRNQYKEILELAKRTKIPLVSTSQICIMFIMCVAIFIGILLKIWSPIFNTQNFGPKRS